MFTSLLPDVEIPDVGIHEFLFGSLREEDLARPAVIDPKTGAETTYGALSAQIDALAGALAARDVGVGTVVALLCPNIPVYLTALYGVLRTGATVTTVNSLSTADEIEVQLRDAGVTWAVTISPLLAPIAEAASRVGIADDRLIVIDGAPGHPDLLSLLSEKRAAPDVAFDPATHVALLPYSSGTSGTPKGVMLSDRNLIANILQMKTVTDVRPENRVHALMPFFHAYGLCVILGVPLIGRAALVPMARFDFIEFLGDVERTRCSHLFIAPPIVVALAKHPAVAEFDLASVEVVYSGAAPLDGGTMQAASDRVGAPVLQGFGMTELSPAGFLPVLGRPDIPLGSVGLLVPNDTCRIVDIASGEEIADFGADGWTEPGELWIAGPNVMLGYLGNLEATDATIDADGFLHTGDVGRAHRDGYFEIVDRVKELIKYHGHQVAPAELEALLLSNPQIADAAVIGVKDADGEEIPKAFVVPLPGATLTADEVMEYVAERVEPHKKVRLVEFVDAIPKSAAGKILRRRLRDREALARQ
ncbi:AMP-binding protein [Microbacterium sp. ASV49]|uniref:AMP-binding protein n=1 Tax=Microbacterium candidum TaxID=3041922 RepID=A0ABT7MXK0_9MICO|nr:AMP-binding protein [Microbacterium sp. ASV49]MDL9979179.1 AMP-binding protein [Microbacterium sp. ASV49]